MSQPYLDSAGNVNTAVANDLQNFAFAMRQQAIPGTPVPAAVVAAVIADAITGLTNSVTDV